MDLEGKRILVVEDDYLLAEEMCQNLRKQGAVVLGPAPTPFYAMHLLGRRGVDGAVLDVKLHGATVFGLADELTRRGTPIVFATGYGEDAMPERYRTLPRLTKPFDRSQLIKAVFDLGQRQAAPIVLQAALRTEISVVESAHPRTRMMRAISAIMRRSRQSAVSRR